MLRSKRLFGMLAALLAAVSRILIANTAWALPNALRLTTISSNIRGAYSAIETVNPNVGSSWTYHRTYVSDDGPPFRFAEIGWVKGYSGKTNPTVFVAYLDAWGNRSEWFGTEPSVGTTYNYQLTNDQDGWWDFYFNSLSTPVLVRNLVWSVGDAAAHGGETNDTSADMGSVDYGNSSYRKDTDGTWYCACSTDLQNTHPNDYEVVYSGHPSDDWTVQDK